MLPILHSALSYRKNGNHQQCNVWDHSDPWYGFSSRFSINHQVEEYGNHQQSHSHSHSDSWFGFSSRLSTNHHIEEHGNHQQSHSHSLSDPWFGFSSRFFTFCKESLSTLRTWYSLAIRRHLGNHLIFNDHWISSYNIRSHLCKCLIFEFACWMEWIPCFGQLLKSHPSEN